MLSFPGLVCYTIVNSRPGPLRPADQFLYKYREVFSMAKGQKAAPRSEWAESTKQKQVQWQKINRAKLSADLPKQEGDSFRAICKKENVSVSAALSVFVRAAIQAGTLDIIRDNIPGRENADQENDTPGTVGIPKNSSV